MKTNLLAGNYLIRALLFSLVLSHISSFSLAQKKVYANGQESTTSGLLCVGCGVDHPERAVGNNESDYSVIKTDLGILAGIEQTLYFPETSKLNNLVIGFGSDNNIPISLLLSAQLLSSISVETYYEGGGLQLYKESQIITNNLVKVDPQDPNKATIEFTPTNLYNRAKITFRGILGLNNKLRIYYAYYKEISRCSPPANPIHYYPFNGNTSDYSGATTVFNLFTTSIGNTVFKDSMICKEGLSYLPADPTYTIRNTLNPLPVPQPKAPRTVSFWARIDKGGYIDLTLYGERIKITEDSIIIRPVDENHNFDKKYFGRMSRPNPIPTGNSLNFYTLDFNNDPTPQYENSYYQNVSLFHPPYYPVDFCLSVNGSPSSAPFPIGVNGSGFPATNYCTHWAPYYTGKSDTTFMISLNKAQMDEFLIYGKKISPSRLFDAYSQSITIDSSIVKKTSLPENNIFIISPNPTTGSITLDGNMSLIDSYITIRNISGKEVYHPKIGSKTFDLPSTLPNGIYVLSIETKDGKIHSRKIILSR